MSHFIGGGRKEEAAPPGLNESFHCNWCTDYRTNHFSGNHEFDPAILLTTGSRVVSGYGLQFSKTF
jgi:hypothetical protein